VEASLDGRVDRALISRQLRYYFGIQYKAHASLGSFANANDVADDHQITKQLNALSDVQARADTRPPAVFPRTASRLQFETAVTRMGRTYKMRAYDRSRLELACAQVDPTGEGLRLEEFFQLAQARKTVPNGITYHATWDGMRYQGAAPRGIHSVASGMAVPSSSWRSTIRYLTLAAPPPARATASRL
jgi:hypothetical protein